MTSSTEPITESRIMRHQVLPGQYDRSLRAISRWHRWAVKESKMDKKDRKWFRNNTIRRHQIMMKRTALRRELRALGVTV